MNAILVLTSIVMVLSIIIVKLLVKISILTKKNKYVDEADMWHRLAVTDDLTGLYNRNAYNIHIEKITKNIKKSMIGIIIFDVDDFKKTNDTKGHLAGDAVLKKVATIISEVFCDPQYRVFRIGGDEFSVLTENVSEEEIINRLIILNEQLKFEDSIRLSKGYAIINENAEEAFKYADEMLYADKFSKKI